MLADACSQFVKFLAALPQLLGVCPAARLPFLLDASVVFFEMGELTLDRNVVLDEVNARFDLDLVAGLYILQVAVLRLGLREVSI